MVILSYSAGISRDEFIAEMKEHRAADRLVAGSYWSAGSGCAVGCGVETINRKRGTAILHDDHAGLAAALGWPKWLTPLEDKIFESLPAGDRVNWPVNLAVAVPQGVDLEPALNRILARILREIALPVAGESAGIVEQVAAGCATDWANDCPSAARTAADAAARAADAAARAADAAARAAAGAAEWAVGAAAAGAGARLLVQQCRRIRQPRAWRKIAAIVLEEVARCS